VTVVVRMVGVVMAAVAVGDLEGVADGTRDIHTHTDIQHARGGFS
jgi:hypothetical protein